MKDSPVDSVAIPKVTIDWYRSTPWWRFASQSVVISWRSTHLLSCAVALLLTQFWLNTTYWMFSPDKAVRQDWISPREPAQSLLSKLDVQGTVSPLRVWEQFLFPVYQWLSDPTLRGAAFCLASVIGIVAIWSFVGGCLARRSVVELGTKMTAPWAESVQFVFKRWQSIAWSVTMPSGLILMIAVVPLFLGWLSNIPAVGPWLAGLLMIPVVLLSIGIGWCAAITVFGFPLSVCAIVSEKGADAYDGISRSAAYTFQRPLTLALCVIAAQFLGNLGGTLLSLVLMTGQGVVSASFDIGSFTSLKDFEPMWGPVLRGIVPLLLTAYGFSFFWTASAATYLILRRDVDHAEFDLIDMGSQQPKPLPELPKLESTPASKEVSVVPVSSIPENTAE